MSRFLYTVVASLCLSGFAVACDQCNPIVNVAAKTDKAESSKAAESATEKKNRLIAEAVWAKILARLEIVPGENWPENLDTTIVFKVVEAVETSQGFSDKLNAVASRLQDETGELVIKNGKFVPLVRITSGYIELLASSEDGIAFVLGHELGHHALGHTVRKPQFKPDALAAADGHRREADADLFGARLMLKAEFSLRKGVRAEWVGWDNRGGIAAATLQTCRSHPGDTDRAARLFAILDKGEEQLWRCMSAFENGVTFLALENYLAAEDCFLRVIREFPNCYEAWANLGLAQLLHYCDHLTAEEIRESGIGHFVGTAYPTARSVQAIRIRGSQLWQEAVDTLKRADELKPGSPVILANLGLAYLVNPAGKGQKIGEAYRCLDEAQRALQQNRDVPARVRLTLLINFAAAASADGNQKKCKALLDQATTLADKLFGEHTKWPFNIQSAITFNSAVVEADQAAAANLYEEYLKTVPPGNPWWTVARERYESLCKTLERRPLSKDQSVKTLPLRKQLAIELPSVGIIHVGQSLDDAIKILGKPTNTGKARSSLRRLQFATRGIELLTDGEEVFAFTIAAKSLAVEIREVDANGRKLGELRVGMTRADVEALLGMGHPLPLMFFSKEYPYYANLGVAVEYNADDVVIGLIVAQIPTSTGKYD